MYFVMKTNLLMIIKVDGANVDTSDFVESSNQWIQPLEAWA